MNAKQSVILKSGKTIKGQVVSQNVKELTVKQTDGTTKTVPKSQILKVVYKDVSEEEAKKIRLEEERKLRAKEEAARRKREEEIRRKQEEETKRLAAEKKEKEEEARLERERLEKEQEESSSQDTENIAYDSERSRWDIVWRSSVLPGWGFYHADHTITASVYGGLFWGGLMYAVNLRGQVNSQKAAYDQASLFYQFGRPNPANFATQQGVNATGFLVQDTLLSEYVSSSKKDFRGATNQYNGALGFTALVYLIQLTHSYFVGVDWEENPSLSGSESGFLLESNWEASGIQWELRSEFGYIWKF